MELDIKKKFSEMSGRGYTREELQKKLMEAGWTPEQIDNELNISSSPRKSINKTIAIAVILLLVIAIPAFIYFSYISPINVKKPKIEMPIDKKGSQFAMDNSSAPKPEITDQHVEYLVNEIDGYKLHENPLTREKAVIEVHVYDIGKVYSVTIEDNVPVSEEGSADKPDIRIRANSREVLELTQSRDFKGKALELYQQERIGIELISDETTLAMKGYKAIYDSLQK
jgi:hypothetical protein